VTRIAKEDGMAEKQTEVARRQGSDVARREGEWRGPFSLLDRFADEMDRVFDDFGFGRSWLPRPGRGWAGLQQRGGANAWIPAVEVFHRNNELVVRAELPGLKKDEVKVEVADDMLTIQGERKREHEEEHEGLYRSERSYGTFRRVIELPPGTMPDQANATFKDGVLEVTMPAPSEQVRRGRQLEIKS
jgi:HSP20 family protein